MHASPLLLALTSAGLLGFRHGFDYDHIAALTDITSVQPQSRSAMRLGLLYALGHACTVALLGSAVILFQLRLPDHLDHIAERLVGLTLILLSLVVLASLVRRGHAHIPMSRVALAVSGYRWLIWKVGNFFGAKADKPSRVVWSYDNSSAFTIGVIHGLGAETPTQIVVFLLAANLGGIGKGFLGLGVFIAGLLVMNTLMTASAAGIFRFSFHKPVVMRTLTLATAAYSLVMGVIFLSGTASSLPALGG